MQSYKEARCQHIKGEGTQCGSPALRDKQFCYYHEQCRWRDVECYEKWEDPYSNGEIKMPAFDDAHSIQYVIRQVTILLLQKRIEHKTAGLLLYGLQIASSNLKRMAIEKPEPTRVVVDPEKVAETPIGMTPWSASGEGHDVELMASAPEKTSSKRAKKSGAPSEEEIQEQLEELLDLGRHLDDPAPPSKGRRVESAPGQARSADPVSVEPVSGESGSVEPVSDAAESGRTEPKDKLPPGTIQACESPYIM